MRDINPRFFEPVGSISRQQAVLLIDDLLETLTGSLAGLHTWQRLAKRAAAI
jgi:adenine/guanine phosphoribosyltransferase-like PRPP-binding protein